MLFEYSSKNKKLLLAISILVLFFGIMFVILPRFFGESRDIREAQNLVETFGKRFQNVSLLAPREILEKNMKENYGDLVSSPILIAEWVAQASDDPSNVPGRLTSSPWPDRIDILNIESLSKYVYEVKGEVVEIANTDISHAVSKRQITVLVEKRRDLGNKFLISNVILSSYESQIKSGFDNSQMEKAITEYLVTQKRFSWKTRDDSYNFCSIENLDPEQDLFPLYVWAYCAEYIMEDGKLKTLSGSSGPVKVSYPNELSFYDFRKYSYEAPGDGSAYSEDVKRIFPEKLHDLIFNFDRDDIIKRNNAAALVNHFSWEKIRQAVNECGVKEVFQSHSLQVTAELKNGTKINAVEPKIDDIIKIAVSAELRCGRVIMATE